MEQYKSKREIEQKEAIVEDNLPEWLRIVKDYLKTSYEKGLFPHYKYLDS